MGENKKRLLKIKQAWFLLWNLPDWSAKRKLFINDYMKEYRYPSASIVQLVK